MIPGEDIFDTLVKKVTSKEFELQTQVDKASLELAKMRKEIDVLNQVYKAKRGELEDFKRMFSPRLSIVRYFPASTEFFRASFRHYDGALGKSIPRVVHLGPSADWKNENDPGLYFLAKKQTVKYLMKRYPGLYDSF